MIRNVMLTILLTVPVVFWLNLPNAGADAYFEGRSNLFQEDYA